MKFEYDELAQPDREIRVAVLEPGSFEDPIVVRFILRILEDDAPVYQALSYVWGSNDNPSHVYVKAPRHSGTVSITNNLDSALRYLRSEKKLRSLWIDALCINQASTEEKDIQVMNMGKVYKAARSVIAWLGPKDDNSDEGIRLFKDLGSNVDVDWITKCPSLRSRKGKQALTRREERERSLILQMVEGGPIPWTAEQCSSAYPVLSKPYFRRAWILQEVKLARRVVFHCGYAMLPENTLWKAAILLWRSDGPQATICDPEEWSRTLKPLWRLAIIKTAANDIYMSILTVPFSLGHLECGNPRDKIYSFLGIMDASSQELQIVPTYSETTQSVYRGVAQRVYTKMLTLDLMQDCELARIKLDIPSWVPDWSTPVKVHWNVIKWSACAWIATQPSFDESGLRCTVSGISIGSVVEVGGLAPDSWSWRDVCLMLQALRPAVESLESKYITGETVLEVYCRILAGDTLLHSGTSPETILPEFEQDLEALRLVWSKDFSDGGEDQWFDLPETSQLYFETVYTALQGRRLFKTQTGHLGLSTTGTQIGDILCVLLGAQRPVILRPAADNTYLVVGSCYAHGLMNGEAIYHNSYTAERNLRIVERNGFPDLVDCGDGMRYSNAGEMLEKAGIKIKGNHPSPRARVPHIYIVPPDTLKAVGVQVKDIILV
ncbi:heterokaryon incompatibility protein-domain-containing protein [Boeremia exigua]|uniref:heterokaryon incompatibility protein-domain-containing protein n=1 Tax=Boeremia exigua TaxID=749465 RepID=UPI001E8D5566|nr:heterokaryon incompatibility protein-domain-containing protein [Boeremia exigua]KAH6612465.1 heterokaryon incompatibility protein-domain-containing protein [Boeremia exigua]